MMKNFGQLVFYFRDIVHECLEVLDHPLDDKGKAAGGELIEVPLLNNGYMAFAVIAKGAL
jgi:hypothetical protein